MDTNPYDPPTTKPHAGSAGLRLVGVTLRSLGAVGAVAVVFTCMEWFNVPWPSRAVLGLMVSLPMVAVIGVGNLVAIARVHVLLAATTVVGAVTVYPCTGAHFVFAPAAALGALGMFEASRVGLVGILSRG